MTEQLVSCPCGAVPTELSVTDAGQGSKWANVSGNCCGMWSIEFRTQYNSLDTPETMALATQAWNSAPRSRDV